MYSTQAISNIAELLKEAHGVCLALCVCDNQKFNLIVNAYRQGEITLEIAAQEALSTIIKQPKIQ